VGVKFSEEDQLPSTTEWSTNPGAGTRPSFIIHRKTDVRIWQTGEKAPPVAGLFKTII